MWFNIVNAIIAGAILQIFGTDNQTIFAISTSYLGISWASTWGGVFGFLETRFNVTGMMIAIVTVASCVGQSVLTMIVGLYIDNYPMIAPITVNVSNIGMFIVFLVICLMCRKYFPPKYNIEK